MAYPTPDGGRIHPSPVRAPGPLCHMRQRTLLSMLRLLAHGRHDIRRSGSVAVSRLLFRELAMRAEPRTHPVPAPGQRRRLTFDADGRPVCHPFPVFSGELPVPEPRSATTVAAEPVTVQPLLGAA